MRLTKYEKETILRTSEGDDTWSIYTFNASLKRRLREYAGKHPDLCRQLDGRGFAPGAVEYEIKKDRLSIRLLPPCSEARREAVGRIGRTKGFGSVKKEMSATADTTG